MRFRSSHINISFRFVVVHHFLRPTIYWTFPRHIKNLQGLIPSCALSYRLDQWGRIRRFHKKTIGQLGEVLVFRLPIAGIDDDGNSLRLMQR
jgi:hypothetical protein